MHTNGAPAASGRLPTTDLGSSCAFRRFAHGWAVAWGAAVLALALSTCGGEGRALPCDVAAGGGDGTGGTDTGRPPETVAPDVGGPGDAVAPDLGGPDARGGFGAPCNGNDDCATGFCVATAGGYVCTRRCAEGCPDGWVCAAISNTAPDTQYVCRPASALLCARCHGDHQCGEGYCLTYADGVAYCSEPCAAGLRCARGYTCAPEQASEEDPGLVSAQCRPMSGTCDCGPLVADQERRCFVENALGRCFGFERCAPNEGWVDCSAPTPQAETCNGHDDDCNGLIDDGVAVPSDPCHVTNAFGTCAGAYRCAGSDGLVCDAPTPAAEVCDFVDNDCDGQTDEAFVDASSGAYVHPEHCGTCGYACRDAIPFAATTECVRGDDAAPRCRLVSCLAGYRKPPAFDLCIPDGAASDCSPCASDDNCATLPGRCVLIDGRRHCARTCAVDADCPAAYRCDAGVCRPRSASCACMAGQEGVVRPCYVANVHGVCFATQGCRGALGWTECAAATPAAEACNGLDDDCDGLTDEDGARGCAPWFRDQDGDEAGCDVDVRCLCAPVGEYTAAVGGDCDDTDADAHPGAAEVCNGHDDDCDGRVDEPPALGCTAYFSDRDRDRYGVTDEHRCLCAPVYPFTATTDGDCDDLRGTVSPGAAELCNGRDDDCDGVTDEALAFGCRPAFADADVDGYGDPAHSLCLCAPTIDHPVSVAGDCADGDAAVHPGAAEACNGRDDDCDGVTDGEDAVGCRAYYRDEDDDGYGAPYSARCQCAPAGSFTALHGGDCDDTDPDWRPGRAESCESDADCCRDDHRCRFGWCVRTPRPCSDAADCWDDSDCVFGECLPFGVGPYAEGAAPMADPACVRPTVPELFRPTVQCEWSGPPPFDPYPDHIHVISTPMVVDFDFDDDPETIQPSIVFVAYNHTDGDDSSAGGPTADPSRYYGVIRIIDGRDCSPIANLEPVKVVGAGSVAIADVTGDGRPDVAAHDVVGGLTLYAYDAARGLFGPVWESHTADGLPHRPYAGINRWGGPSIADVDGDGVPEVVMATYVYDRTGRLRAANLGLQHYAGGHLPVIVDVDHDGFPELVLGSGVFRYEVRPEGDRWVREGYNTASAEGFVAVADFGAFPVPGLLPDLPEIVVVSNGQARVMDLSGRTVFGPHALPFFAPATGPGMGGPPTVGDFDRDGRPPKSTTYPSTKRVETGGRCKT